eukprot:194960-Chlamydomonas_euryale.AAC.6
MRNGASVHFCALRLAPSGAYTSASKQPCQTRTFRSRWYWRVNGAVAAVQLASIHPAWSGRYTHCTEIKSLGWSPYHHHTLSRHAGMATSAHAPRLPA